jgi:hypothetical protein
LRNPFKSDTDDPLMRLFLEKYRLNLLSVPRENTSVGDVYIIDDKSIKFASPLGNIQYFLDPHPIWFFKDKDWYCKVDANYSPTDVGDLLTTSPTLRHAMKADDAIKAIGSVIGKSSPGGAGTITTPTTAIPSNNVTGLHVYDNSTMVLEFGNGTTLASPYSNVWRISFSPAGNQTIGNTTTGVGTTPPPGGGAPPPPSGGGGGAEDQQQLEEDQQQLEEDQQQPQADEQQIQADEQQLEEDEQ